MCEVFYYFTINNIFLSPDYEGMEDGAVSRQHRHKKI